MGCNILLFLHIFVHKQWHSVADTRTGLVPAIGDTHPFSHPYNLILYPSGLWGLEQCVSYVCFMVAPRMSRGMSLLDLWASETSRSGLTLIQVLEGDVPAQWFCLGLVREISGSSELRMEVIWREPWWILRTRNLLVSVALDPLYITFCNMLPQRTVNPMPLANVAFTLIF